VAASRVHLIEASISFEKDFYPTAGTQKANCTQAIEQEQHT
jgi:hypothetical protein